MMKRMHRVGSPALAALLLAAVGALLGAGCRLVKVGGGQASLLQDPVEVFRNPEGVTREFSKIRVAAYNIQDFTDGVMDDFMRTPTVTARQAASAAALIDEVDPDLLLLVEIENGAALQMLNARLKNPYPIGYVGQFDSGEGRGAKLNLGVLSRLDILKARELDFSTLVMSNRPPRGALSVVVDLGDNHALLVYGVHLKANFGDPAATVAKRQSALSVVRAHAELVQESSPATIWEVVLLGDMNVDPDLESFTHDESLLPVSDWVDLWRGRPIEERITIPTRKGDPMLEFPAACFDRILVSPSLQEKPWRAGTITSLMKGVDTENVFTRPGESAGHVSDHYPVYVDLIR